MLDLRTLPTALTLAILLVAVAFAAALPGRTAEAAPAGPVGIGDLRCEASGGVAVDLYWQPSGAGQQWLDFSFVNNNFAAGTFTSVGPLEPGQSSATYSLVAGATHYVRVNTWTGSGWQAGPTTYFTTTSCASPKAAPAAPSAGATITLSFDDQADFYRVSGILDTLGAYGAKAVFCVTGNWARANAGLIERMRHEGHTLCNHTASHPVLTQLSDEAIRAEILGGVQSNLLRPPYGVYDARVARIAASLGYDLYLWTIDTRDWDGRSAESIVNTVVSNLRPGAVVLLHLQAPHTYEALPRIIASIRERGYQLGPPSQSPVD